MSRPTNTHATKLLALAALGLVAGFVGSFGCASPGVGTYSPASEDDLTESKPEKKTTKSKTPDKNASSSSSGGDDFGLFGDDDDDGASGGRPPKGPKGGSSSTAPTSSTVPTAPTGTTPPVGTTPTTTDASELCFLACVRPDLRTNAYITCAVKCGQDDVNCDDLCWEQSGCTQNENACMSVLNTCDQRCPSTN